VVERNNSTRLGQILIEKGLLTAAQLDIAIHEQTRRRQQLNPLNGNLSANTSLGEILIELGFINRLALNRGLNWQLALRKMAIVMSFCAPLMTASYSAAAATVGAFTQPTFTARSSSSSAESKPTPSFTKSSSSASSAPNNSSSSTSSVPNWETIPDKTASSVASSAISSTPISTISSSSRSSTSSQIASSSSKSSATSSKAASPDLIAPQMPKTAMASALHDQVYLSWAAATDNVGVTRYRVYRDQTQLDVLAGDETEFFDFSVAPSKTYVYGISAGDGVGNWSPIKSLIVQTAAAPLEEKVTTSSAASSTSSVANIASSSSSKAPIFTSSSSSAASVAPSSSASSVSSKAASSSPAVSSSSSSKAAISSSSSSLSSSSASSAAAVAGPVNLNWVPPVARENGNTLDITEVGGYELRYRKVADTTYTYVSINDAWTNTYNFSWLEGSYVFQIAAYDKNGLYSTFVDLAPK
jgi:hypothetical protein